MYGLKGDKEEKGTFFFHLSAGYVLDRLIIRILEIMMSSHWARLRRADAHCARADIEIECTLACGKALFPFQRRPITQTQSHVQIHFGEKKKEKKSQNYSVFWSMLSLSHYQYKTILTLQTSVAYIKFLLPN